MSNTVLGYLYCTLKTLLLKHMHIICVVNCEWVHNPLWGCVHIYNTTLCNSLVNRNYLMQFLHGSLSYLINLPYGQILCTYVHLWFFFINILQTQAIPTNMIDSTCNSCFLWMIHNFMNDTLFVIYIVP